MKHDLREEDVFAVVNTLFDMHGELARAAFDQNWDGTERDVFYWQAAAIRNAIQHVCKIYLKADAYERTAERINARLGANEERGIAAMAPFGKDNQ